MFFLLFFILYGGANLYIGWRGWQALAGCLPPDSGKWYALLLSFFALAYIAARVGQKSLPESVSILLTYVGAYWLAIVYYGFLFTLAADSIRLLNHVFPFIPDVIKQRPYPALAVLALVILTIAIGAWNARNPVVTRHEIAIGKAGGAIKAVRAVAVSDIHLGSLIGASRLAQLVNSINQLNPDVVFLVGDIIDGELQPYIAQDMGSILKQIKSKFGVYAVLGNHEYIGGEAEGIVKALEQAGVKVLRDQKLMVGDSFIVAGRDEYSRHHYGARQRLPLPELLAGTDMSKPVLLLDHQPADLDEARLAKVDLQISGHTHRGQLFPNHLITSAIYEIDWGYLKKDSLQILVSLGYGTWGPPLRTGHRPELLDIHITFSGEK